MEAVACIRPTYPWLGIRERLGVRSHPRPVGNIELRVCDLSGNHSEDPYLCVERRQKSEGVSASTTPAGGMVSSDGSIGGKPQQHNEDVRAAANGGMVCLDR